MIQVSGRDNPGDSRLLQFADGSEVVVTAHVFKEGPLLEEEAAAAVSALIWKLKK